MSRRLQIDHADGRQKTDARAMKTPPFALVLVLGATGGAIEALGFGIGGDGAPPRGRMALVSVTLGLEDLASSYLVAGGYVRDASDLRLLPRPRLRTRRRPRRPSGRRRWPSSS